MNKKITGDTVLRQKLEGISIIVPAYNEVESLLELLRRLKITCGSSLHEIIIVDDGSIDDTPRILRQAAKEISALRIFILRRNFGKSMALAVGFEKARYPIVVTIDADLQDHPEDISVLITKLQEGFDVVSGQRSRRNDGILRKLVSWLFNYTVRRLTGLKFRDLNCGLKAYRSEVVKTVPVYGQFHRYIPLLAHLTGFKVTEAKVSNSPRKFGGSNYKTFRYEGIWDLFSILFTYNFRLRPLHFFAKLALLFLIPSAVILLFLVVEYFFWLTGYMPDYPNLFPRPLLSMSLTMILIGIIFFVSGFICDFVLHHTITGNLRDVSNTSIREAIDQNRDRER